MEVHKRIKLLITPVIFIITFWGLNAQFFQESSYGYLPLSFSGGGMLFSKGYTVYNKEDTPVRIKFQAFVAENYGLRYTFLNKKNFRLYFGIHWQHIYENIFQTFEAGQLGDNSMALSRNIMWDFYDGVLKVPFGLEANIFKHALLMLEAEPGYYNEGKDFRGSYFSYDNYSRLLSIEWENIKNNPFLFNINVGFKWSMPWKYFIFEPYFYYSYSFIPLYKTRLSIEGIANRSYTHVEGTMYQTGSGWVVGVNLHPMNFIKYVRKLPYHMYEDKNKNLSRFRFYFQLRYLFSDWALMPHNMDSYYDFYSTRFWDYSLGFAYTLYLKYLFKIELGLEYDPIRFRPDFRMEDGRVTFKRLRVGESIYLTGTVQANLKDFFVRLNINPGYYWLYKQKVTLSENHNKLNLALSEWPKFLLDLGLGIGKEFYSQSGKVSLTLKYNWPFYYTWSGDYQMESGVSIYEGTVWQFNEYIGIEWSYTPKSSKSLRHAR